MKCAILSTLAMLTAIYFIVQEGQADYAAKLQCEKAGKVMVSISGSRFCATIESEVRK